MKNDKKSPFCRIPWYSISLSPSGGIGPCCITPDYAGNYQKGESLQSAWNGKKMREFRKNLINGKISKECRSCKDKDEQGIPSLRSIYDNTLNQEVELNENYTKGLLGRLEYIHRLDLSLSNRCNLKCRFCYTGNSTQWFSDRDQLTKLDSHFFSRILGVTNKVFDVDVNSLVVFVKKCKSLREIEIKGGEPMLYKRHKDFLREIIDCGLSKKIKLLYTINGTVFDSEYLELWTHFREVSVTVSVDGLGKVYQYVRGDRLSFEEDVISKLQLINKVSFVDLSIHYTLCVYNFMELPRFMTWLDRSDFSDVCFSLGVVNFPPFLNPEILPQSIIENVTKQLIASKRNEIKNFVKMFKSLNSPPLDQLRSDFLYYTENLDRIRKTSFIDICPQLNLFYNNLKQQFKNHPGFQPRKPLFLKNPYLL